MPDSPGAGLSPPLSIPVPPVRRHLKASRSAQPRSREFPTKPRSPHAIHPVRLRIRRPAPLRPPVFLVLPEGAGGAVRERHAVRMAPAVAVAPTGAGGVRRAVADQALPGAGRLRPYNRRGPHHPRVYGPRSEARRGGTE